MTSHIHETIERLLRLLTAELTKWPHESSNSNLRLQSTLSPWVKPFATPSPPIHAGGPRPTGGRPLLPARLRFSSLPFPANLPAQAALQSVARPVQLPESSYMEEGGA